MSVYEPPDPSPRTLLDCDVTLSASTSTLTSGGSVTFTASVADRTGTGTPTGAIAFYDGGTLLDNESLSGSPVSFTTSSLLATISHTITAVYSGDSNYNSASSPTVTLTPASSGGSGGTGGGGTGGGGSSPIVTTLALIPSATSAMSGDTVTFTALLTTASVGASAASGTVQFYVDGALAGTVALAANAATLGVILTGSATHGATAIYSGDSLYATSTSAGVEVTTSLPALVEFVPWIVKPPTFHTTRDTTTTSGSVSIQNVSGNTVQRDAALLMLKRELTNALFIYRLYRPDTETSLKTIAGYVTDPQIEADGETMTLSLKGMHNWSEIPAPDAEIGVSCALQFASPACGSTNTIPCNNSYGSCSSPERFKGVVLEWAGAALSQSQYVQPAPLRLTNNKRSF